MRITRPAALAALLAAVLLLAACAPAGRQAPVQPSETTTVPTPVRPATVRIGNLPTEDLLPLWVAEEKGLLAKAGLNVQIVPFQSAQERDAAFTARSIDGFMGDILAVSELQQAGFKNRIATVCLGATPAEGRFGIVSSPDSKARSLKDLANIPVGTSSGTIQEYMLDGLMKNAGVPADQVKKEEVKKVPVRFELLMNNDIKAAALPEPFLSLAEKQGAHLVADDTKDGNLTQTVLTFSDTYLQMPEGAETVRRLMQVWDEGAKLIDEDPNAYRALLVEKARLPKPLETTYKVNTYPAHQLPSEQDVDGVLTWMKEKKLLTSNITYDQIVWKPANQ